MTRTIQICAEGWRLFEAWLMSDWDETTPKYGDVFDNEAGRAYWQHRDNCAECTPKKEIEG